MRLIDTSDFTVAPYVIANAAENPSSAMERACAKVIGEIVDNHQDEFLLKVLGDKDVADKLRTAGSISDLDDGTRNICEKLRSPFLSYVYFYILRHSQSVSGITGVYQLISSDKMISPRFRQVQAWNSMALSLRALCLEMNLKTCDCSLLATVNQFNI